MQLFVNVDLFVDWVLFSVIIELTQDAKFAVQQLEPKILNLKVANSDSVQMPSDLGSDLNGNASDLSQVLTKNFENEFQIYKINRFLKPKIRVLKEMEVKGNNRFSPKVLELLTETRKELEEIGDALGKRVEKEWNFVQIQFSLFLSSGHFNHILERSQDTCLTLANVRQSQEANKMGRMMKRLSEVALLFLPLQAIAGLLGMNVQIPFQNCDSTLPFWGIVATSSALVIILYRLNTLASRYPK